MKTVRGFFLIPLIVAIVAAGILGGSIYYFKLSTKQKLASPNFERATNLESTSTPIASTFHLAGDPTFPVSEIKVLVFIVEPADLKSNLRESEWQKLAKDWFSEANDFWEKSLENKVKIYLDYYPIQKGTLKASEYNYAIVAEAVSNTLINDEKYKPYFDKRFGKYLIVSAHVLSDIDHDYGDNYARGSSYGSIGITVAATSPNFDALRFYQLDPSIRGRGVPAQEAHEMGHALGLSHSNEYPEIKKKYASGTHWQSDCDLMLGAGFTQDRNPPENATLHEYACLLPEQKALFF